MQALRGQGQALGLRVGGVLVLDVHRHVRVDLGEGAQDLRPVGHVVPLTADLMAGLEAEPALLESGS